jgi:hypothetical protein
MALLISRSICALTLSLRALVVERVLDADGYLPRDALQQLYVVGRHCVSLPAPQSEDADDVAVRNERHAAEGL